MVDDPFGFDPPTARSAGRGRRGRPFTIADAMILVVATAPALAYLRGTAAGYDYFRLNIVANSPIAGWITCGEWVVSAFLTSWTFALLLLRACPPRAGGVRLARQPGLIACVSACGAMVAAIPYYYPFGWGWEGFRHIWGPWNALLCLVNHCGLLVLVAWGVLAVTRAWRPEAGWIDATGRLLGASWIALYLASIADHVARSNGW